jgi:MFS family permease
VVIAREGRDEPVSTADRATPGQAAAAGSGPARLAGTAAGADPTARVSTGWTTRFTLLWLGFWMGWLVPIQLVLPNQFDAVDPASKVRDFGITNGAAGVVALIALPLAGALCDHTKSRWGRRRVWMAAGVAVFAVSLAVTGLQHSWAGVMVCWLFASLGFSMASAGLFAAVADHVPVAQRGMISGAIFGPQALGLLVGLVLLTQVVTSNTGGYLVLTVALIILAGPFVLRYREALAPRSSLPLTPRGLAAAMWVSPREHPDFAWAFGGRVMVNIGNALGTTYLLYFFTDDLHLHDPDNALLVTTAIYLVFTLATTYGGGLASDRSGRRRVFVAVASVLQGVAALLLVGWPSFTAALAAAAFLGAGYGAFLSVDQALVTQVLPDAGSRAKDLGIMNIGTNVPQSLAPLGAALIIDQLGGYRTLFAAAGVFTLIGAVMVYRIGSVR